jgi:hypothetical protein
MPPPTDAGTFRLTSDAMHNVALSGGAQASFWLTSRVGGRVVSVRVLVDGIHLQEEWPVGGGPNPPTVTMAQLEAMAERARAAWRAPATPRTTNMPRYISRPMVAYYGGGWASQTFEFGGAWDEEQGAPRFLSKRKPKAPEPEPTLRPAGGRRFMLDDE